MDAGDGCRQLVSEGSWDPARGPNCHHYRINAGISIRVHPGERDQPLHGDLALWEPFVPNDPGTPQYEMVFHLALTDFTAANGATRFVPGSHLWPKERLARREDVRPHAAAPGDPAPGLPGQRQRQLRQGPELREPA